jgi:alpha-D-ribose 1-methylphosphonate 5-phosphate C-P lyase
MTAYNFAYLDEHTKRMIRRSILKAVAIPGYQVPFGSREMPLSYGWGTGGVQVTAAVIGPEDVLEGHRSGRRRYDQRREHPPFLRAHDGVRTTTRTEDATLIQTRHRIETPLRAGQIMVFQVPIPEPLRWLESRETETRKMHALEEYGVMHVRLYEDIAQHGRVATAYDYPVRVNGRYIMRPSPIPKFDNPKLDRSPALLLFGAGREKRIYAVPPWTPVKSLDFDDHPFTIEKWTSPAACAALGRASSTRSSSMTRGTAARLLRHRLLPAPSRGPAMIPRPLLSVRGLTKHYGQRIGVSISASTCGRARCWEWSENRARARPRSSIASAAASSRRRVAWPSLSATARSWISSR